MDNNKKNKIKEYNELFKLMSIVSNIGFTMIACIMVGFFIGVAIDKYIIDTKTVAIIVFTILGVFSGFWSVYKFVTKKILK
jgi:F0F1-type ATP synthase assembly protein I